MTVMIIVLIVTGCREQLTDTFAENNKTEAIEEKMESVDNSVTEQSNRQSKWQMLFSEFRPINRV
jgi:ribonuclease D